MRFDGLISTIKMVGNGREVWLTNDTFNELGKQAIRLNRKDNLIIYSGDIEIEISLEGKLVSNCSTSFARVERVSEVFPNTRLIKRDIYTSPKKSQKLSLIL